MAECDLNYERLMRLFPNVLSEDKRCISLLSESREDSQRTVVELQVNERSRYTTLIQLVQRPRLSWDAVQTCVFACTTTRKVPR